MIKFQLLIRKFILNNKTNNEIINLNNNNENENNLNKNLINNNENNINKINKFFNNDKNKKLTKNLIKRIIKLKIKKLKNEMKNFNLISECEKLIDDYYHPDHLNQINLLIKIIFIRLENDQISTSDQKIYFIDQKFSSIHFLIYLENFNPISFFILLKKNLNLKNELKNKLKIKKINKKNFQKNNKNKNEKNINKNNNKKNEKTINKIIKKIFNKKIIFYSEELKVNLIGIFTLKSNFYLEKNDQKNAIRSLLIALYLYNSISKNTITFEIGDLLIILKKLLNFLFDRSNLELNFGEFSALFSIIFYFSSFYFYHFLNDNFNKKIYLNIENENENFIKNINNNKNDNNNKNINLINLNNRNNNLINNNNINNINNNFNMNNNNKINNNDNNNNINNINNKNNVNNEKENEKEKSRKEKFKIIFAKVMIKNNRSKEAIPILENLILNLIENSKDKKRNWKSAIVLTIFRLYIKSLFLIDRLFDENNLLYRSISLLSFSSVFIFFLSFI